MLPLECWPDTLEKTELVTCINSRDQLIESCEYWEINTQNYYTVGRYRRFYDITLYEATTGCVLARTTIRGSMPDSFPNMITGNKKKLYGSTEPSSSDYAGFEAWLKQYVE